MKKRSLGLLIALALLLPAALAQATTTTVMMYMCGTDLQSYCVQDMYEMASVDLPEDVTVAVQAGGAYEWDDSDLTGEAINRFTIRYDAFNDVETYPWQNMGQADALRFHRLGGRSSPGRPLHPRAVGSRRRIRRRVLRRDGGLRQPDHPRGQRRAV